MPYKTLNLDLAKSPILKSIVYGRIGDSDMQTVTVNITSRDTPVDLTGYTLTFEGITNGGKTKVFDVGGIHSTPDGLKKGMFNYTFPNMAFAVAGNYEIAYFSIMKEGKRDTTGEFDIIVGSNADIDAEEAETIITLYDELVAQLKAVTADYISGTDSKFEDISQQIEDFQGFINSYKAQVEGVASEAIQSISDALEELEAGNFYTKEEADDRFALKGEWGNSYTKEESDDRFASKDDLVNKAENSEVVHLTGDETVEGEKTFTERIKVSDDVDETEVPYGDGFESYAGQQPIFYKQNGRVYIEGACRPYTIIPKGGGVMFFLPEGCRPSTPRSVLCQGSGMNVWCLTVEVNGQVKVLRYRPTNSTSAETDIPVGAWLPFALSFKATD